MEKLSENQISVFDGKYVERTVLSSRRRKENSY
jgi:hypothetical protein